MTPMTSNTGPSRRAWALALWLALLFVFGTGSVQASEKARAGVQVGAAQQLELVRAFLAAELGRAPADVDVSSRIALDPFPLPRTGAPELRVEWVGRPGIGTDGSARLRLVARQNGLQIASRGLVVRVRVYGQGLSVVRSVRAGEPIGRADVVLRRVELTGLGARVRGSLGAAGLIATRALKAGEVLTDKNVRSAPLVERGRQVSAVARRAGLEIRARAIALTSGAEGEIIRVRNASSGRVVEARVVAPDTVEVLIP